MPRGRQKNPIRFPKEQKVFECLVRQRNTQNQRNLRAVQHDKALQTSSALNKNSNQVQFNNVYEINSQTPYENQNNNNFNNEVSDHGRIARRTA